MEQFVPAVLGKLVINVNELIVLLATYKLILISYQCIFHIHIANQAFCHAGSCSLDLFFVSRRMEETKTLKV